MLFNLTANNERGVHHLKRINKTEKLLLGVSTIFSYGSPHFVIKGEKGSGKSTFLRFLEEFLDKDKDFVQFFGEDDISKLFPLFKTHINKYYVIYLDFSDFRCESFYSAIKYFKEKMTEIYKQHYNYFLNDCKPYYTKYENYLDVIESKYHGVILQESLKELLRIYYNAQRNNPRPAPLALLIDNISQTEYYARKYGYAEKMESFLRHFLGEEYPVKCADVYVQIGDYFLKEKCFADISEGIERYCVSYHCQDVFPSYIDDNVFKDVFADFISSKAVEKDNLKNIIENKREWIKQERLHDREEKYKACLEEKRRYNKCFSKDFKSPYKILGLRKLLINNLNQKYKELNDYLKLLYNKYLVNDKNADFIYRELQNFCDKQRTDWNSQFLYSVKDLQQKNTAKWNRYWSNDDFYWSYIGFVDSYDNNFNSCSQIKIYVTFNNLQIKDVFLDSVKYLSENGEKSFAAKISKYSRNDHICYWVYKNEFLLLKDFFKAYQNNLIMPMKFIAYENGLGISHEMNFKSHNSLNADIISRYFSYVNNCDEISLSQMYSLFVEGWNNKLPKKNPFSYFKNSNADEFAVIIATMQLFFGEQIEENKNLLLCDSKKLWNSLSYSKCWGDFEARYTYRK